MIGGAIIIAAILLRSAGPWMKKGLKAKSG